MGSGTAGNGGAIGLRATNGTISSNSSLDTFSVSEGDSGNGGKIVLEAGQGISGLTVTTVASGGQSGDVEIKGSGNLLIDSLNVQTAQTVTVCVQFPCSGKPGRTTSVSLNGRSQAGNVRVDGTGDLTFLNSLIQSDTLGANPSGNITITSPGAISFNNSQLSSNTQAAGTAGNIAINAGQAIAVTDSSTIEARTSSTGIAGNVTLNAPILTVAGNAQISAETSGSGAGGNITINAPTAVNLSRFQNDSPVLSVQTSGAGQAGNIEINTPSLTLADQARITATATATATNTQGGGSITLNASDLFLAGVVGVFAETQGQSPAGTLRLNPYANQSDLSIALTPNSQISASTSGSGNGGDLIVSAPRSITIAGPGKLAVETTGSGDAGDIRFTTQQLTLKDGVKISASTSGSGKAGDIIVNLRDRLLLSGPNTQLFAGTEPDSTGDGGSIFIDPRLVEVRDRASIAVSSKGSGIGGNITLQAGRLRLLNQGTIAAETASSQGGNIFLTIRDYLLMRHNSRISATAGTAQAGGDGGNITINAPFIVGILKENSDITANAFTGSGGRVTINTQGIFGLKSQLRITPNSDITASSQFGLSGVVTISAPNVDPAQGAIELPTTLVDPSRQIAQGCNPGGRLADRSNRFTIVGRGGTSASPTDAFTGEQALVQVMDAIPTTAQQQQDDRPVNTSQAFRPASISEAHTWRQNQDGSLSLVAESNYTLSPDPAFPDLACAQN